MEQKTCKTVKVFGFLKSLMVHVTCCQNLLVSYFEIPVVGQNGKRVSNYFVKEEY